MEGGIQQDSWPLVPPYFPSSGFVNMLLSLHFFPFFKDWSGGVNRGHVSLKNYG